MSYPPAYDRTVYRGVTLDQMTKHAIIEAERRLGRPLVLLQGSYNAGRVGASAGTHDGGGAVDIAATDHVRVVKVLRRLGFAAWHRPAIPGVWGEHIHAVLIGNARLSPAAQRQVTAYRQGRDGLAGNGPDTAWRPSPIPTFAYPPIETRGPVVDRAEADLVKARKAAKRNDKPVKLRRLKASLKALREITIKKRWTR